MTSNQNIYTLISQDGSWPNDQRGSIVISLRADTEHEAVAKMHEILNPSNQQP